MATPEQIDSFDVVGAQLATPSDYIRWGASCFAAAELHFGQGTGDGFDDAAALVFHALRLPHTTPAHLLDAQLLPSERRRIYDLFRRRITERIPSAYLTGETWFAGLRFMVDRRVLVPRSPIAELVERSFEPWLAAETVGRVLDLCTGSGCIAIACAVAFPAASVDATDLSTDALEVAAANVALHGLAGRVALHHGDLWADCATGYDLIVANPPYVDADEMAALPPEHRHEPVLALAAGRDGLDLAVRILREAPRYLAPGGLLCCEVGASAPALEARFPAVAFTWVEFERGGDGVFVMSREELVASAAGLAG